MTDDCILTISKVLFKNHILQHLLTWYIKRYSSFEELKIATEQIERVIQGKDLFEGVRIDKTKSDNVIETVGNNSIAGIIHDIDGFCSRFIHGGF